MQRLRGVRFSSGKIGGVLHFDILHVLHERKSCDQQHSHRAQHAEPQLMRRERVHGVLRSVSSMAAAWVPSIVFLLVGQRFARQRRKGVMRDIDGVSRHRRGDILRYAAELCDGGGAIIRSTLYKAQINAQNLAASLPIAILPFEREQPRIVAKPVAQGFKRLPGLRRRCGEQTLALERGAQVAQRLHGTRGFLRSGQLLLQTGQPPGGFVIGESQF